MISERHIASQFHSLWGEALPLLTPSFVRLFNEAFVDELSDYPQSELHSIPIGPNIEKHDLVAEFSFQMAKEASKHGASIEELKETPEMVEAAYNNAVKFLAHYEPDDMRALLNNDEVDESIVLSGQYEKFFKELKLSNIEFSPHITGSGFMNKCNADLSVAETLYEVKTVSRNISGNDIRQLFVYLALQATAGEQKWTHAGFFNPRRALHYRFSIDHLVYRISGGKSTSDVFRYIVGFLHREVELDSVF